MSQYEWQVFCHGLARQGVRRVRLRSDLFSELFELFAGSVFMTGMLSDKPRLTYLGYPNRSVVIERKP